MKKFLALLLAFCFAVCSPCTVYATAGEEAATTEHPETTEYPEDPTRAPELVSNAAIVIDATSGQILYEKNAYDQKYPASITKILTVALALEKNTDMSEIITISENAVWDIDRDSTLIGLDVGEKITFGDCVYSAMVKSDNTCAYALAEYVAGDTKAFAELMNAKAKELGCENSNFVTPNGLHDDNHHSCAYDMALITKYALENEAFREVSSTLFYEVPATNLAEETRPMWNGNKMINPQEPYYYEYCEGGKTGYTSKANNTLMTYAKKDNLELICIILDCDGLKYSYSDTRALYNYCFNNYSYYYPLSDFSFESDDKDIVQTNSILENYYNSLNHELMDLSVDKNFSILLNKTVDTAQIQRDITLYDTARDNVLGEISFSYEGVTLGTSPIKSSTLPLSSSLSKEEEPEEKISTWKQIGKIALLILAVIIVIIVLFLLYLFFAAIIRNIRRKLNNPYRYRKRRRRRKRDNDYFF